MTSPGSAPRLVLHFGPPKTATSSLQAWCHANRDILAGHGILYAETDDPDNPKHQWLVPGLVRGDLTRLARQLDPATTGDARTVILSCEGVMVHRARIPDQSWHRFRQMTAGFDRTLFMVHRDADAWLRSFWTQHVINPVPRKDRFAKMTFEQFAAQDQVTSMMDLDGLSAEFQAATGTTQTVIAPMGAGMLAEFRRVIGLPDDVETGQATRVNEAVPVELVTLYLRLAARSADPRPLRAALFWVWVEMYGASSLMVLRTAADFARSSAADRLCALRDLTDALACDDAEDAALNRYAQAVAARALAVQARLAAPQQDGAGGA